jgi:hypothetical protein
MRDFENGLRGCGRLQRGFRLHRRRFREAGRRNELFETAAEIVRNVFGVRQPWCEHQCSDSAGNCGDA